jgi:GNAT superfamily N-acetyltransferase
VRRHADADLRRKILVETESSSPAAARVEPRRTSFGEFLISNDRSLLQFDRIHRFLSQDAYWSKDIPRAVVEKAAQNSICFGVYHHGLQVAYGRIVSDYATFAWLSDIYVENEFRGQGVSKQLVEFMMAEPAMQNLRRVCLATKDAHSLYTRFGFEITKTPTFWMEIKNNDIYKTKL